MAETLAGPVTPATTTTEALSPEDAADRAESLKVQEKAKEAPPPAEEDDEDDDFQSQADDMFYGKDKDSKAEEPKKEPEKKPEAKKEEKKESKGEDKDEAPKTEAKKPADSPASPKDYTEIEFKDRKIRVHKEDADALQEVQERSQALERGLQEQVELLTRKPMETLLDHFTYALGGDREAAYQKVLDAAAQVVRAEVEYQQLPPEQRKLKEFESKAQKLERELSEYRKREAEDKARAARAQATERMMGEIVRAFKDTGIPQDKSLAFQVAKDLELLTSQGKKVPVRDVLKFRAEERDQAEKVRQTSLEEKLRQMSPEDIAKQYPELVSRVREWDVARLESEKRSPAKTPPKAEPKEDKPPTQKKPLLMGPVELSRYFTGR